MAFGDLEMDELINAILRKDESVICSLLDNGIDVNRYDGDDGVLHIASGNGYDSIVSLLIEKGADVNLKNHVRILDPHLTLFLCYSILFRVERLLFTLPLAMGMSQLSLC